MNKIRFTLLLLIIGINFSPAQSLFESVSSEANNQNEKETRLEVNGSLRGLAFGGSENYDYTNVFGEVTLKGKLSNGKAFLFGDFRIREGIFFNNRELQVQLKEAYAGYRGKRFDVLLGNQIVTWGRTDGFNPTNSITPNDYFFLTNDPDDQKLSNFMLRGKIKFLNYADLEVIAIPFYRSSVYRYDLFQVQEGVNYAQLQFPEVKFENSTVASRLNFELPSIGFSLSYFYGYDPFYGFTLKEFSLIPLNINYAPTPYRKHAAGADFAIPIQSWIFRGEMAFSLTKDYEQNMHIPNPDIAYVAGIERNFFDITAIFQYIGKYTLNFKELEKPVLGGLSQDELMQFFTEMIPYESKQYNRKIFYQQEETNHAVMLSLTRLFFYDQLQTELTGYYNITSEEYMIRPALKWSISDGLSAHAGASLMYGPEGSIFNMSNKVLNGVFVGLEVKF